MNNKKKIINLVYFIIITLIILIGIYLRFKLYFAKLPFWLDEIMLSLSFIDRDIWGMFLPLEANQKSPPLFLLGTFVIVKLFGFNEYSFRLLPVVSGISSLFLFYILLKDVIKNKIGIIAGMFIFSVSIGLVYYSAEFKQYSSDVVICIMLLILYKWLDISNISIKKTLIYTIASIILVLFSFPSMFIIPAIVITKMISGRKLNPKALIILSGVILSGLALCFYDLQVFHFMRNFWCDFDQNGCIVFYNNFLYYYLQNNCMYFIYDFNFKNVIFLIGLLVLGCGILYKDNKEKAILVSLIYVFAFSASVLKIYPFTGRLMLYFIPIYIMLLAKNFDISPIKTKIKGINFITNVILTILMIFILGVKIPFYNIPFNAMVDYKLQYDRSRSKELREKVKECSHELLKNYKDGEKILACEGLLYAVKYYKKYFKYTNPIDIRSYGNIDFKETSKVSAKFIDENININFWIYSRNNETYFRCSDIEEIENILNSKKIKYNEKKFDEIFLIHTIN